MLSLARARNAAVKLSDSKDIEGTLRVVTGGDDINCKSTDKVAGVTI